MRSTAAVLGKMGRLEHTRTTPQQHRAPASLTLPASEPNSIWSSLCMDEMSVLQPTPGAMNAMTPPILRICYINFWTTSWVCPVLPWKPVGCAHTCAVSDQIVSCSLLATSPCSMNTCCRLGVCYNHQIPSLSMQCSLTASLSLMLAPLFR